MPLSYKTQFCCHYLCNFHLTHMQNVRLELSQRISFVSFRHIYRNLLNRWNEYNSYTQWIFFFPDNGVISKHTWIILLYGISCVTDSAATTGSENVNWYVLARIFLGNLDSWTARLCGTHIVSPIVTDTSDLMTTRRLPKRGHLPSDTVTGVISWLITKANNNIRTTWMIFTVKLIAY